MLIMCIDNYYTAFLVLFFLWRFNTMKKILYIVIANNMDLQKQKKTKRNEIRNKRKDEIQNITEQVYNYREKNIPMIALQI